nr:hypothetical protein GCM10025732_46080 [Glycomyces mayteni]
MPVGSEHRGERPVEPLQVVLVGDHQQCTAARRGGGSGGLGEPRGPVLAGHGAPGDPRGLPGAQRTEERLARVISIPVIERRRGHRQPLAGRLLLDAHLPLGQRQAQDVGEVARIPVGDPLRERGDLGREHRAGRDDVEDREDLPGELRAVADGEDGALELPVAEPDRDPAPGHHVVEQFHRNAVVEQLVELRQRVVHAHCRITHRVLLHPIKVPGAPDVGRRPARNRWAAS